MAKDKRHQSRKKCSSSNIISRVLAASVFLLGLGMWGVNRCSQDGDNTETALPGKAAATSTDEQWKYSAGQTNTETTVSRDEETTPVDNAAIADHAAATVKKGGAKLLEMPATQRGEVIISHTGYCLSYNNKTNCPNWVAWELTSLEAQAQGRRSDEFAPDPQVEERCRVTTDDYRGSGYDRGHMCPAADMKWDPTAQRECFYMSNMCPQLHALNAGGWEKLENACRRWAEQEGSVYIVCGPVFNDGRKVRTIGRAHQVRVPDGFFKVVLSLCKGKEKAIGFYYANNDGKQTMEATAMTVDEVEAMTGYDFFYQIDKKLEKRVESQSNLKDWQ